MTTIEPSAAAHHAEAETEVGRRGLVARTGRSVLLVLAGTGTPTYALRRAYALAAWRNARLHVLQILTAEGYASPLFPQVSYRSAIENLKAGYAAAQHTREWIERALPSRLGESELTVARGNLVSEIVETCRQRNTEAIVVAHEDLGDGLLVAGLAQDTGLPVLVANASRRSSVVVAASDMRDGRFPVLTQGEALAVAQNATLVLVHNVCPTILPPCGDQTEPLFIPNEADRSARTHVLSDFAAGLSPCTVVEVIESVRTSQAILRAADVHHADLVVVGVHPRTTERKLRLASVAAQVVDGASCSVWVNPLPR